MIKQLTVISLWLAMFSVNADNNLNKVKGEAIINISGEAYRLSLQKCYQATNTVEGKTVEAFIIATHQSRKSKEPGHRFTALGSKTSDKAKGSYRLQLGGGFLNGGTEFSGKIPYDSFSDNKLVFKGKSNSIKRKNKEVIKRVVPIEINVTCFKSAN